MAYSNGKITSPVSIADLQNCFQVKLQATISGVVTTKYSSDLVTIITAKVGDTVTDANGITWKVVSRKNINPWSKYKPVAARATANNVPARLTEAQLLAENYGVELAWDSYSSNDQWANLLADTDALANGGGIKVREFNRTHNQWVRMTDLVSPTSPTTIGYNQYAEPAEVAITGSYTWQLKPLIPEGQRNMIIRASDTQWRFEFPFDQDGLECLYYPDEMGVTVTKTSDGQLSDDALSIFEAAANSTNATALLSNVRANLSNGQPNRAMRPVRGVYIAMLNESSGAWIGGRAISDDAPSRTVNHIYSTDQKDAWLDLCSTAKNNNSLYLNFRNPNSGNSEMVYTDKMEGTFLFVEYYYAHPADGSDGVYVPIPGYVYEVTIQRVADDADTSGTADISNKILFIKVGNDGADVFVQFYAKLADGVSSHSADSLMAAMASLYQSLTITINGTAYDLLSSTDAVYSPGRVMTSGSYAGYNDNLVYFAIPTIPTSGTAVITAVKQDGNTYTKTIQITN